MSSEQHIPAGHKISIESRRELHNVIVASLSSIVSNTHWNWLKTRAQVFADGNNADIDGSPIDRYAVAVYDLDNFPNALFSVMIDANHNTFTAISQVGDEAIQDPSLDNPNVKTLRGTAVHFDDNGDVDTVAGGVNTVAPIINLGAEFIANIVVEHEKTVADNKISVEDASMSKNEDDNG